MVRPRRATRPPIIVRIARIGVPVVVAGALATGVAVAYWPESQSVTADPPIPATATPLTNAREDRPDRSTDRPSDPPSAEDKAAEEKAAKEKAAKEKAAKEKAAKEKAAKEKAAKEKAAEEKAEREAEEKAAEEKAKREAEEKKAQEESEDDSEGAGSQKSGDDSGGSEEKSGDSGSEKDAEQDTYREPTDWEEVGDRYVTTNLNLRVEPSMDSRVVKVLAEGSKVTGTSTEKGDYTLVVYSGDPRWLATEYLSKDKPEAKEESDSGSDSDSDSDSGSDSGSGGISSEPCPNGSDVEDGLTQDAIRVHRAICHRFPSITDYIGVRSASFGYHPSGRAVDAMVDGDLGWEVARWVRANADELGVSEVIHAQKIWTVQRSGEGWRGMEDRGSVSANHFDHVHISVYGDSGSS